jgi:trk system potassium uptake protein
VYIIIVGGGKVGYYLAKTLVPEKHKIVLIEEDIELCKKISGEMSDLGIGLVHGDGTNALYLEDAEIRHADILIAVTGQDQDNLVACQLAKKHFGVPRTIARVNNPKNINVFKQLSVDSVVSSSAHIANIIEHEVDWANINQMLAHKVGDVRLKDMWVSEGAFADGRVLADLNLPKGIMLVSVIRDKNAFVPDGQTRILAGDSLIIMTHKDNQNKLDNYFTSSREEAK